VSRIVLRAPPVAFVLIVTLGACSLIAPLEDVKDNRAGGAGTGGAGQGSGGNGGTTARDAGDCPGVFDESVFDEACFQ
jgi:hypothetical protein